MKKSMALLLALVMLLGCLTGCSSTPDQPETQVSNTGESSAQETEAAVDDGAFPLEEKVTLTVWMMNESALINATDGDMNNAPFFQELEKRTNVHIEWVVPAAGTETEQFNLMLASGDLCDIMYFNNAYYSESLDAAVEDGYFLDLTDLLPIYAPDYLAALAETDEECQRSCITPQGRYVEVATLAKKRHAEGAINWMGYMIRQDWLDKYSLEVPVTYEDWENVLTVFRDNGATAPLAILGMNLFGLGAGMGVYSYTPGDFYQIDGKVGCALYTDAEASFEYLTMLNRWYENGLIDPDFASSTAWMSGDLALVATGATGIFESMYTMPESYYYPSMEEGVKFTGIVPPRQSAEDKILCSPDIASEKGMGYVISADCEYPEIALKWMNYLFTEEGSMLASYGVEGDTYTLDENGDPVFTEKITNNPEGYSVDEAIRLYTLAPGLPTGHVESERELQLTSQEAKDIAMVWTNYLATDYNYPANAALTEEENDEYAKIMADLQTYIYENVIGFVIGTKSLDEWDTFVQEMKDKGIERCIELKQMALDRYNAN